MPQVVFSRKAEAELYRLPRDVVASFQVVFDSLERAPFQSGPSFRVRQLREAGGRWVARFGGYGAIYRVEGPSVLILKVGPRSALYREL